jgi:hypothetical protein
LPHELEKQLEVLLNHVRAAKAEHGYGSDLIINMDETAVYFDMLPV